MTHLMGVQRTAVATWWPLVRKSVSDAVDHGTSIFDADSVRSALERGDMQLWIVWDGPPDEPNIRAIAVTEIRIGPRAKVCGVFLCTGYGRQDWQQHLSTIEAWAASIGCDRMSLCARPGWKRVLPEYRMTHVMLEKDLRQ